MNIMQERKVEDFLKFMFWFDYENVERQGREGGSEMWKSSGI